MVSKLFLEENIKKIFLIYQSYNIKKIEKIISLLHPYYKNKNIYFRDYQWKSKQKSCLLIEFINLIERLDEYKNYEYGDERWKYSHFDHFLRYLINIIEKDILYVNNINSILLTSIQNNYNIPSVIYQNILNYL